MISSFKKYTALFLVSFIFLYLFYCYYEVFQSSCPKSNDYILILLNIENAKTFDVLTGPYSRFGFRHLGPFSFYLYSFLDFFSFFLKSDYGSYRFIQFLINFISLFLSLLLLIKYFRRSLEALLLLFLALVIYQVKNPAIIINLWNPTSIVFPTLLFIISSSLVVTGRLKYLWLSTFCFSFISQTHIGVFPVALIVFITSTILGLFANFNLKKLIPAFIILVISFFPVFYEAFVIEEFGNLGKIYSSLKGEGGGKWYNSLMLLTKYYFGNLDNRNLRLMLWISLIVIPLFVNSNDFLRSLKKINLLGIFISFYSILRVKGDFYYYLLYFHYSFVVISYFILILSLYSIINQKLKYILNIVLIISFFYVYDIPHKRNYKRDCSYRGIYEPFLQYIPQKEEVRYKLTLLNRGALSPVANIALELKRRDIDFCVDDTWWFVYGRMLTCSYKQQIENKKIVSLRFMTRKEKQEIDTENVLQTKNIRMYKN